VKKYFLYLVYASIIAATVILWWQSSGELVLQGGYLATIAIGRLFGLLGELAILTQLVLIGRITWIEQEFGHDKMNKLHRYIGYSILTFFVGHPLLLTIGYAGQNNVGLISQFINFLTTWEDVLSAFFALLLFIAIVCISIPNVRRKIKYEQWYFTHLLIYVAIYLAFEHQLHGEDVARVVFTRYWLTLNFTVFGLFILYRFVRVWYKFWKHRFYVEKVEQETSDVHSIYIKGRNMEKFKYHAGQFNNWTFLQKGMWFKHPFTISTAPNGKHIRISAKAVGDFTKKIKDLKPGTKVIVDGPLGIFTEKMAKKNKFLLIAGGIGVTPLRALAESLHQKNKDTVLLYGSRTLPETALYKELQHFIPKEKFHLIFSHEKREGFENGYLDKEKLARLVPDFKDREIYICGPKPMMKLVIGYLAELGVPKSQIHYEIFGY
jgi:predicted ferric reductase